MGIYWAQIAVCGFLQRLPAGEEPPSRNAPGVGRMGPVRVPGVAPSGGWIPLGCGSPLGLEDKGVDKCGICRRNPTAPAMRLRCA